MDPAIWLVLAALGGWAALDGTSAGQFMVGRPLVTATVGGAILGDAGAGFLVGVALEVAHLGAVPIGGARIPEPGPAAIPAAALALGVGGSAGVVAGLGLGVVLSVVGGGTILLHRRLNGLLVSSIERRGMSPERLRRGIGIVLAADAARGAALTAGGLLLASALAGPARAFWPLGDAASTGLALALVAYPAGVAASGFAPRRGRLPLLSIGLALGLLLALGVRG